MPSLPVIHPGTSLRVDAPGLLEEIVQKERVRELDGNLFDHGQHVASENSSAIFASDLDDQKNTQKILCDPCIFRLQRRDLGVFAQAIRMISCAPHRVIELVLVD